MPVVAATRLKRYIGDGNLFRRNAGEVAVADEILRVSRVRFADRENHFTLEYCLGILAGRVFRPYIFGETECRPSLGPSGIETDVGDDLGDFGAGDAIFLRLLKMEAQ